eukprot:11442842-Alexandrium_andersonii.AAC.1
MLELGRFWIKRWKTALVAMQPRGSRARVLAFRDPLRMFYVIVIYAPRGGRPVGERKAYHEEFRGLLGEIPGACP